MRGALAKDAFPAPLLRRLLQDGERLKARTASVDSVGFDAFAALN